MTILFVFIMKGLNDLADISKLPKMRLLMFSALVAAGASQLGSTALAADGSISEHDMLDQAVALYEKLSGSEVDVPAGLAENSEELFLGKSVVLGFINADEMDTVSEAATLRKQDAMTVLYKTIIDFDDSYALSTDEVDKLMNKCYDNALIDEENRVGYAFMIKHGIIDSSGSTEPNKEITWKSCGILVDLLYDMFVQDISFDVSGTTVKIGSNISSVTEVLGEPDRIDKSDYEFDWYIYNSDYSRFMMIGVDEGRICAFYTNCADFSMGDIRSGDDYLSTYKYAEDSSYRFFADQEEKIDAIMYNPREKSESFEENDTNIRACELVDLINAKRVSDGNEPLVISPELWQNAADMAVQPKYKLAAVEAKTSMVSDNATHVAGYDVFSLYAKLVAGDAECFKSGNTAAGVGNTITDSGYTMASIITGDADSKEIKKTLTTSAEDAQELSETVTEIPEATEEIAAQEVDLTEKTADEAEIKQESAEDTVQPKETEQIVVSDGKESSVFGAVAESAALITETSAPQDTVSEENVGEEDKADTENSSTPVIVSPQNEAEIKEGEKVVIELEKSVSSEYYVRIYSFEDDEYIVDSYIRTDENKLEFDPGLFSAGKDYSISVSSVTTESVSEAAETIIRYGSVSDNAVTLLTPQEDLVTDNDFIELAWESDLYHDFVIDIYDMEGKLVLSREVYDSYEAKVQNVSPGDYFIYVSAVRRGDRETIKAQDSVKVTVKLPEPVITEYILEEGEKFYPVYKDEDMGLVYFYEEEIIDIDTTASNGKKTTVQKKKITEKQVKATNYYSQLAAAQQKVEYFEGSDKLDLKDNSNVISTFSNGVLTLEGDSTVGNAIVEEAKKYLGVPYVWGGTTPSGFDCSGLVQYVCKSLGIDVSRVSQDQYNDGVAVSREELQPGDLVFFQQGGDVHHVGIYVGDGMMIHAPYTGTVVQYQSIDTPYYSSQFCGGRRVY